MDLCLGYNICIYSSDLQESDGAAIHRASANPLL